MKTKIYTSETISKALTTALRSGDFYWNQWSWDNFLQLNTETFKKIKTESYGSYDWAFDFRHGGVIQINDNLPNNTVRVKAYSWSTLKIKLFPIKREDAERLR